MKRYLLLAIFMFALVPSWAFADTVTGLINWVNPYGNQMLVNGYEWFTLSPGANTSAVQVGNNVTLTFSERAGERIVTKVIPSPRKS